MIGGFLQFKNKYVSVILIFYKKTKLSRALNDPHNKHKKFMLIYDDTHQQIFVMDSRS